MLIKNEKLNICGTFLIHHISADLEMIHICSLFISITSINVISITNRNVHTLMRMKHVPLKHFNLINWFEEDYFSCFPVPITSAIPSTKHEIIFKNITGVKLCLIHLFKVLLFKHNSFCIKSTVNTTKGVYPL